MKFSVLSLIVGLCWGQIPILRNGSGGGGSTCGPNCSISGNVTIGGDISAGSPIKSFATALATPSAPTVTPTCSVAGGETCSTSYTYLVAWTRTSSLSLISPVSSGTTINNGPDTLTASNFNSIDPGTCPSGVSNYLIYQSAPNFGLVASHSCGSTYSDQGSYPFSLTDGDGPYQRSWDTSTGTLLNRLVILPMANDTYPFLYAGTELNAMSDLWLGLNYSPLMQAVAQISYSGSNTGNGVYSGLAVNTDVTSSNAFLVGIGSNTAAATGTVYGYEANIIGGDGISKLYGYVASPQFTVTAETVGTVAGFVANPPFVNGSNPTISTRAIGFYSRNQSGLGGAGKDFSFYGEGGTMHVATGGATYVGMEVVSASSQSADLFRTLASDGSTLLSAIDSAGRWRQPQQTPASAGANCTANTIAYDTGFIYICTATNTWKRVAIATW